MLPDPGSAVRVVMTKWGDRPHWEFDATYLGSDEHGDWLGIARSTVMTRPGMTYVAPTAQVGLVPAPGPDVERGWLATFHDVGGPVQVYVDITTPPVWDGAVLRAVDLDLDVVRGNTGRVWVDDEDEFEAEEIDGERYVAYWVHDGDLAARGIRLVPRELVPMLEKVV